MKIKKELRRWAMLALVLVLLLSNTIRVSADTGESTVIVDNSSQVSSTDNSRSESSKTENSNNTLITTTPHQRLQEPYRATYSLLA